jgi:phage gpG-like protein
MKKTKIYLKLKELKKRIRAGAYKTLNHAAASIRLTARRSIRRSRKAAKPGKPPHTRAGQLKRSLYYSVDKQKSSVVIGPKYSVMGKSAAVHEFGKRHRGRKYPKREFMKPALMKNKNRLPKKWNNVV